jgi:hypothetical protein
MTATVLQQRVQLPHPRPSTSGREDADAAAFSCGAGWADEEIVMPPSLAPGFGDIKPEPSATMGHSRRAQTDLYRSAPELRPRQHVPPPNRQLTVVREEAEMGKGILLWLLGIPLPIIIILLLIWH